MDSMTKYNYIYLHKRRTILAFSIIILLSLYFFNNSSFILRAFSSISLLTFFYFLDHMFDVKFKIRHYTFMILIIIFSLLLSPLYFSYPNYDKVQHFIQPILLASMIFHLINKLKLELKWKITFTLFTTLGILGLFELGEYALDHLFDLKLQGVYLRDFEGIEKFNLIVDRIDDTMIDLFLGMIGTLLYSLALIIKHRKTLSKKNHSSI